MSATARRRILASLGLDALVASLAVPVAVWLAAPGQAPPAAWWALALPASAAALLAAGWAGGLPRQYWRFASLRDLLAIVAAAAATAVVLWVALHMAGAWRPANPGFPVLHALVLAAMLAAPRAVARLRQGARAAAYGQPVLLVGTAEGADLFIRALAQERAPPYRVAGIVAVNDRQSGRRIQGLPILGTAEDLPAVLDAMRAEGQPPALLVLAAPGLQGEALRALLDAAEAHGVPVRRAPSATLLAPAAAEEPRAAAGASGAAPRAATGLSLRPIEIEDLLDRPQLPLDREGMARLIQGRRVLVTGAGGTIGGELARQLAALGPATLTLLDHGEYALYGIELELRERHPDIPRRAVLADIRDEPRIRRLFEELRPDFVFHAAALKHVPMVENDPLEGLLTNALGTRIVADAARRAGCALMVFVSTDKAVNPTSVMGASKRLAEMYCQALDRAARLDGAEAEGAGMRLVTVRFGNVLGSTGSVVPLFRRQLERGGPLTVTHPDMRRYFMTVREAVGLVLQASVAGAAGLPWFGGQDGVPELKEGGIFVLDMGAPVKIVELARRMIRLAGLRPDEDVEIRFTGLRPGEKLFEELFHGQEPPRATAFPGLLVATPRTADAAEVGRAIDALALLCRRGAAAAALAELGRLVPEFATAGGAVQAAE